jgi:hypothetical protein
MGAARGARAPAPADPQTPPLLHPHPPQSRPWGPTRLVPSVGARPSPAPCGGSCSSALLPLSPPPPLTPTPTPPLSSPHIPHSQVARPGGGPNAPCPTGGGSPIACARTVPRTDPRTPWIDWHIRPHGARQRTRPRHPRRRKGGIIPDPPGSGKRGLLDTSAPPPPSAPSPNRPTVPTAQPQDLVLPCFKQPHEHSYSPYMGAPAHLLQPPNCRNRPTAGPGPPLLQAASRVQPLALSGRSPQEPGHTGVLPGRRGAAAGRQGVPVQQVGVAPRCGQVWT